MASRLYLRLASLELSGSAREYALAKALIYAGQPATAQALLTGSMDRRALFSWEAGRVKDIADSFLDIGDLVNAQYWYRRCQPYTEGVADRLNVVGYVRLIEKEKYALSVSQPTKPHYLERQAFHGLRRWSRASLPLLVYAERAGRDSNLALMRSEFFAALDRWVEVSGGRLGYRVTSDPAEADIVCLFRLGMGMIGGTTEVEASSDGRGGRHINRAIITLNLTDARGCLRFTDKQVRSTCLHEVGHALGLLAHSTNSSDIMFPTERDVRPTNIDLSARDTETISILYAAYPPCPSRRRELAPLRAVAGRLGGRPARNAASLR